MAFESLTQVSSQSLIKLQGELKGLSKKLMDCYELLSSDLSELSENWQDAKFEEFEDEFKSSKEKIREISERYLEFADKYLPPRIKLIEEAEGRNMGLGR